MLNPVEEQVRVGRVDLQQQVGHSNSENLLRLVSEVSGLQKVVSVDPAPKLPSAVTGTTGQPLVLAAEANAEQARQVSQWLGAEYRIIAINSGQEALHETREMAPDMVIANVLLPGLDGIELCRRLKHDALAKPIPVVLLGPAGSESFELRAFQAGADDYLVKPPNPFLLRVRVANLLRSRRMLEEWLRQEASRQRSDFSTNRVDTQFLRRTTEIIEERLGDFQFDVDQLAGALFISRRQMLRKLKAITGYPPNAFIRMCRLKRAAGLLKTSGMTVTEITYAVGFSDLKHFRTLFREHFGVLPTQYALG